MLKLKQLQAKKKAEEAKKLQSTSPTPSNKGIRSSPAKIRIEKDLKELETTSLPKNISLEFPDANNKMNFFIIIKPNSGYYKNGSFKFSVEINENYPIEPPKIKCLPKIYHPNIDLKGNVCLNVLREEWTPALDMYRVIMGLVILFSEPNPNDPLNKDAANVLAKDPRLFRNHVNTSMNGYYINEEKYDKVLN